MVIHSLFIYLLMLCMLFVHFGCAFVHIGADKLLSLVKHLSFLWTTFETEYSHTGRFV